MSELSINKLNIEELESLILSAKTRLAELRIEAGPDSDTVENIAGVYLNNKQVWEGDISTVYDGGQGLVVIPSIIIDKNKSGAHSCVQATISDSEESRNIREQNFWVWDEIAPTHRFSKTVKIGAVRRTIAVHQLTHGLTVTFHNRGKKDERSFHERLDSKSYEISLDDDGDIEMNEVSCEWNNLPLPPEGMNQ